MPFAPHHLELDLYTLGYVFETITEELLKRESWNHGLSVGVHRNDFVGPILIVSIQPTGSALRGLSGKVKSLTNDPTTLGFPVKVGLVFTGTVVPRGQLCALFFQAEKIIFRREPRSRSPQSEDIGIARIISPDNQFQMRIAVHQPSAPGKVLVMVNLATGLQSMLLGLASNDRWETFRAKVHMDTLDGILVADVTVEKVPIGSGDVGRGAADVGDESTAA